MSLENIKLYIVALAILHNIAIDMKEDLDETYEIENAPEEPRPAPVPPGSQAGQAARAAFIETFF